MSFIAAFTTLGVSLKNVFRQQNTVPLPWKQVRPRPERFRSSFALVHNEHGDQACIGCQMCERICPSQVISVEPGPKAVSPNTGKKRGWHKDFTIDLNACIFCELCVQVCPVDSIVMVRVPHPAGVGRNDQVLNPDKLYANEAKAQSWANGSKLSTMQAPPPKKKPAPKKRPAPETAAPEKAAPPRPEPYLAEPVKVDSPVIDLPEATTETPTEPTEAPTSPIRPTDLPEPSLRPPAHTEEVD